jgi:hypothetical protein
MMSEFGYIKLHRKILENPIVCKDCETFSIWVYLLLNATHEEIPALFKGNKIILKEGQLLTGIISISDKLHINRSKVQRTLKLFENDKQIEQQTSSQNRLVTILNWNEYQKNEKQNEKQMTNEWKTNDKPMTTNKNVRNNIYLFIINKYKQNFPKNYAEKIKIIGEIKNSKEYQQLSLEEQDKLYLELMNCKRS